MTQEQNKDESPSGETWAGAVKEFFRQLGGLATLILIILTVGQCTDCIDVYRLLGR
jgi:hypothetical protein